MHSIPFAERSLASSISLRLPKVGLAGICLLLIAPYARSEEGRRPLFEQATITQSGSYIVTSDFTVASGSALVIDASQVTIDLNGKTIGTTVIGGAPLIQVGTTVQRLTIRNGQLTGGQYAIYGGGPQLTLVVHRVSISDAYQGLAVSARIADVRDSVLTTELVAIGVGAQNIYVLGNAIRQQLNPAHDSSCGISINGFVTATVRDNTIQCEAYNAAGAIYVSGAAASSTALIDHNVITGGPAQAGILVVSGANTISNNTITGFHTAAINLLSDGNSVLGNRLSYGSGPVNVGIAAGGSHNVLSGNLVTRYSTGISVWGSRSRIEANTVQDCRDYGLRVDGSFHVVTGNQAQSALSAGSTGLELQGQSIVYLDNFLLGNLGSNFSDLGANNVDAGGNVF